jgi:uncharacterized membrane protein YdjX (TVP38/TMEM64 family)
VTPSLGRREIGAGLLVGVVLATTLLTSPEATLADLQNLADRPLLFAVVLGGLYLVRAFLGWPTMALSTLVGFGYGLVGLPVALVGAVLTSVPPFYAARWFGRDSSALERLGASGQRYFDATGHVRGVTAARLAPIPADAVTAAAGLGRVGFGAYAVGTLLGELPWTVAAVVVGSSARTLVVGDLGSLTLPLLVGTVLAALALLAGPLYRAFAENSHQKVSEQS